MGSKDILGIEKAKKEESSFSIVHADAMVQYEPGMDATLNVEQVQVP